MKEPIRSSDYLWAARAELAEQEEQLIQALVANGAVPPAVSHVASASNSLLLKRARGIARAHPEVLAHSADSFITQMSEYAALHPGSHPAGICADAAEFKRFIRARQGRYRPQSLRTAPVVSKSISNSVILDEAAHLLTEPGWLTRNADISIGNVGATPCVART